MKKLFLSLVFLFLVSLNFGFAQAKTEVYTETHTEVSGENASVHTEITNIVNGKEVKVESDSPGEIKVEIKNGEVKIESDTEASPTVVISDLTAEDERKKEEQKTVSQVREIQLKISSFLENFFLRLREILFFWKRK